MYKKIVSLTLVFILLCSNVFAKTLSEINEELLTNLEKDLESINDYDKVFSLELKCMAEMYLNLAKHYNSKGKEKDLNKLENRLSKNNKKSEKNQENFLYISYESLYHIADKLTEKNNNFDISVVMNDYEEILKGCKNREDRFVNLLYRCVDLLYIICSEIDSSKNENAISGLYDEFVAMEEKAKTNHEQIINGFNKISEFTMMWMVCLDDTGIAKSTIKEMLAKMNEKSKEDSDTKILLYIYNIAYTINAMSEMIENYK